MPTPDKLFSFCISGARGPHHNAVRLEPMLLESVASKKGCWGMLPQVKLRYALVFRPGLRNAVRIQVFARGLYVVGGRVSKWAPKVRKSVMTHAGPGPRGYKNFPPN